MSELHISGTPGPDRAAAMQQITSWGVVAISGLLLVFGWGLQVDFLIRPSTEISAVAPSTLACALLSAACLILSGPATPARAGFVRVAAIAIAVFSAYLVVRNFWTGAGVLLGDRMSGGTAFEFLLFAVALYVALDPARRGRSFAFVLATIGLVASFLPLLAFALDPRGAWNMDVLSAMSPVTATLLLLLFTALLARFYNEGWVRVLLSEGPGGTTARRYVPLAVFAPVALAFAGLTLTDDGMRYSGAHLGVFALIIVGAGVVTILWTAGAENDREALAQRENLLLRAMLNSIDSTAVFILDEAGRVQMRNQLARDMFRTPGPQEAWLLEEVFFRLSDHHPLQGRENPVRRLLDDPAEAEHLVGWAAPDGRERALNFTASPLPAAAPDPALVMVSVEDQTESWLLRTALSDGERNEGVGQLTGGVAHEMANIFGIVQISAESARFEAQSKKTLQNLDAILQACRRGSDLTHKLLDVTRGSGTQTEDLEVTSVLRTVANLAARVMPSFVEFDVRLSVRPCMLRCARTDLEGAALNLLANARNAIAESDQGRGRIELELHVEGNEICITVSDDGPGIPDAALERVREPYFTTRASRGGRGIGLTLVDTFARRTDGSFELAPNTPKGTRAELRLPMLEVARPQPRATPEDDGQDLTGYRLLVAESDPMFRSILSDGLRVTGATVKTVANGQDALDQLRADVAPDVLITNFKLPDGVEGSALARALSETSPASRVIFLSGSVDSATRQSAEGIGLVLGKPVPLADLTNAISLVSPMSPQ